jgi:hypothetical protein
MKLITASLAAYGGAILLSLSPWSTASAQTEMTPAPTAAVAHGDWTLRQREDWLNDRLEKSRNDGTLERGESDRARRDMSDLRHEEDRLRASAHGQLTDNQTADLEARLDTMAAKIKWANAAAYAQPW